ncbi:hypothetical protein HYW30_00650 [Candidatus Azambacteria bacterium]|nr:hypothetical protein [Candidatus Azambacteria bacterium]MBI2587801.1 hypothetical protein [Candidatus Azambacteria bacterium]
MRLSLAKFTAVFSRIFGWIQAHLLLSLALLNLGLLLWAGVIFFRDVWQPLQTPPPVRPDRAAFDRALFERVVKRLQERTVLPPAKEYRDVFR